jgi:hypothetical protein
MWPFFFKKTLALIKKFVFLPSLKKRKMPDRLRAGLQILVLTMLVRIQLGQQANPFSAAEGVFCFSADNLSLLKVQVAFCCEA